LELGEHDFCLFKERAEGVATQPCSKSQPGNAGPGP
jgi:hypothetical protein